MAPCSGSRPEGAGLPGDGSGAGDLLPVLFLVAATSAVLLAPVHAEPGGTTAEPGSLTTGRVRVPLDAGAGWSRSSPLPAGDVVLVGAVPPPGAVVQVRARRASGWSSWQSLVADEDHGPDPGTAEAGRAAARGEVAAQPVWVGRVEALQLRSRGGPSTIALDLVAVPSLGDLLPSLLGPGDTPEPSEPAFPRPRIRGREAWGPRRAVPDHEPPSPDYAADVRHVVIHHTASVWRGSRCSEADDMIRAIYRYHVEFNGWDDIGYNFLVDPCGHIWEGRAGGVGRPVIGAHAGGWNRGSTGIALLGTYDGTDGVTRRGLGAIDDLVAWKTDLHGIDPTDSTTETSSGGGSSRTPRGRRATFPTIHGHRRTNHTTCPGHELNRWVVGGEGRRSMGQRVEARHRAHGVG